jgi:hypothetical protein
MKVNIFLLLFLAGSCLETSAQSPEVIDSRIKNEIDRLNADALLIYSFSCNGCSSADSCNIEPTHYLFWKKEGHFFLKRFDYCRSFDEVNLASNNPLRYYLANKKTIDNEEVGKDKTHVSPVAAVTDYSYHHSLITRVKDETIKKIVDVNDLDAGKPDDEFDCIYCNHRRRIKTEALIDKITVFIKRLETSKKFVLR